MFKAVIFDFDGVLVESVDVKTNAFKKLFEKEPEEVVEKIIEYHLKNGGISRFEKFRYYYRHFLKRPLSKKKKRNWEKVFANSNKKSNRSILGRRSQRDIRVFFNRLPL